MKKQLKLNKMCLYPKLIKNRKYIANKKNGGNIPPISDLRVLMVPVGCGKCIECKKQKSREWSIRLQEEIRHDNKAIFVTLTFEDKWYQEISKKYSIKGDNNIATIAMRLWLERIRKKTKRMKKYIPNNNKSKK